MFYKKNLVLTILLIVWAMIFVACSTRAEVTDTIPQPTPAVPTEVSQTYADPFAYCAAVGTIDTPDARYTGPAINAAIINGYKEAAGLQDSPMPLGIFEKTTTWRCMNGQVYSCNYGANLPCSSKANVEKTPSPAMVEYCQANLDSEFIPLSVTGHATIYSWHCVKDTPEMLNQIVNVDSAGYLATIWYLTSPNASSSPVSSVTPELPGTSAGNGDAMNGDGTQILFASNRGGAYDDLYLMDLATEQVTRLTLGETNTYPGPFSPDGSRILFTGYGLTTSYVGVMDADGTHPLNLTQSEVDEGFAAWSPDGKLIAFTSRRDGNNEIYVMNTDGTQPKRLTDAPKDDFAPTFSPDGSQLAFVSDRDLADGVYSIYLMNSDGSNLRRLTDESGSMYTPTWSPDGKQIAFRLTRDGESDIYVINVDGSGWVNLTNHAGQDWSPSWSPDGSRIAFQTNRDGNWEIYTMNADGTDLQNLTNDPADDQMPYWR